MTKLIPLWYYPGDLDPQFLEEQAREADLIARQAICEIAKELVSRDGE
jgi:hypothetical protein